MCVVGGGGGGFINNPLEESIEKKGKQGRGYHKILNLFSCKCTRITAPSADVISVIALWDNASCGDSDLCEKQVRNNNQSPLPGSKGCVSPKATMNSLNWCPADNDFDGNSNDFDGNSNDPKGIVTNQA